MPAIGADELKKEIHAILKDADLTSTSAKKVRLQLEGRLGLELSGRKQEIDKLVMNYVNSQEAESDDDDDDEEEVESEPEADDSEEEAKKKPVKRSAPEKKTSSKKSKKESDEEGNESGESASSEELKPVKKAAPKKKPTKKKGSGSDSDEDWSKKKKGKKGKGKVTGYTREYKLSPELAKLMGKDAMARHEVVKQVWAIIKERNLYDPNNKQFAICDSELLKVFGTKRFRTFGMMKYLKTHFHD